MFVERKFKYRLQNQTRTTSFSIFRFSASIEISSEVGLGFWMNARSSATRTVVSMEVRFFLRRPTASGVVWGFESALGLFKELSASSNHFWRRGFNLHMFLNDRLSASKREIVVWLKSFPYSFPIARPTSPCVNPVLFINHHYQLINLCTSVHLFIIPITHFALASSYLIWSYVA